MSTALNEAKCPNCGGVLPKSALEGLCPACLLRAGTASEGQHGAEPPRFVPPPIERLNQLFPQLTILKLIGAGGMGAVYKARQPALDRFVALKILPPGPAQGPNFGDRFNREARALARLSHPSIVTVHEFGQAGDLPYFIMEYVDGANLRQLEQAGRLSPREALQIIPQICDALQYAHDEGVVHRDIKPENVLVDRKGRVKIADFGLAKILGVGGDQARLTLEGQVMGTPHYMAPEQVERPLAVDHRADIYSLGVVFYEMLTGDLPLGKFPPPSRKVAVDIRLDEVVLRALENDPARRYQHASEVKSELQTISAPPGTASNPAAPGRERLRHLYFAGLPLVRDCSGKRSVIWSGALTAVGVALVLAACGVWVSHLVTRHSAQELAGVPSLIAILVFAVGLVWNFKRPLPKEPAPVVTGDGTVILSGQRRRVGWSAFGLLAIIPLVVIWGVFAEKELPGIKRALRAPEAAQVARLDSSSHILAVDLPGGAKAELLAVAYRDPAPNQWWRPDGTLVTNELWQIENLGETSSSTTTNRDLIYRVSGLTENADGPVFEVYPAGGYCSGGQVVQGSNYLSHASGLRIGVDPALSSVRLRMGFGLEPWRTISTQDPQAHSLHSETRAGDPPWDVTFNKASDTTEGAQLTLVMGPDLREWERRIVAIDTNGVAHSHSGGTGTSAPGSMTWTYTFRDLSLAAVREFRVQVRPMHWVEFANVRLNPLGPLPMPDRVLFGPAIQLTVSDFIDFDTGKVQEPPSSGNQNVFEGMGETVAWMERSGMDAAVGNGELQPLGMVFVALENQHWDTLSPSELTTRLHQGMFKPPTLKPWKNGQLPSTFGFRTREGGTGILQLLAFDAERPRATLRFKLIQRPVPAAE